MRKKFGAKILALALISILMFVAPWPHLLVEAEPVKVLSIFGQVNRPLNLTVAELLSMPQVSEVVNLKCVLGVPVDTFNWTGVPLFYLLTLAQVKPTAFKVAFRGSDGFSSDLLIDDALKPTVIVALKANGTFLPDVQWLSPDNLGGLRLVVPGKYGYKWVALLTEIEVVDYDYKGTYESGPWSDEANRPDYVPIPVYPQFQQFNFSVGIRNFEVEAFTNISITAFRFNYLQKEIGLNLTAPSGTRGFADVIIPQSLLKGPFSAFSDGNAIAVIEANVTNRSFLYLLFPIGSHIISIVGTEFFGHVPEIMVAFNQSSSVGEAVKFDASSSVSDVQIVSYEWDFGDGTNGTGAIVYHSYSNEGIYHIKLNVTDANGLSNYKTLVVSVGKTAEYIPIALRMFLVATLILLIAMFVVLLKSRKPKAEP